jgi:hypothetical protein
MLLRGGLGSTWIQLATPNDIIHTNTITTTNGDAVCLQLATHRYIFHTNHITNSNGATEILTATLAPASSLILHSGVPALTSANLPWPQGKRWILSVWVTLEKPRKTPHGIIHTNTITTTNGGTVWIQLATPQDIF